MSIRETEIRNLRLNIALSRKKHFIVKIYSERSCYKPDYSGRLSFGNLFLFSSSIGSVAVGRAMQEFSGAYKAFLVPNKNQGTKYLGQVFVETKDILCRLVRI